MPPTSSVIAVKIPHAEASANDDYLRSLLQDTPPGRLVYPAIFPALLFPWGWIMRKHGLRSGWAILLGGILVWASSSVPIWSAEPIDPVPVPSKPAVAIPEIKLPLDQMTPDVRQKIQQVLDKPAITVRGQAESFTCVPSRLIIG